MAGKSGVKAGGAYVEITADDSQLYKALDRSEARVKAFSDSAGKLGTSFTALGTALAAPAVVAAKAFADFEAQMLTARGVTGATDQQMQRLTATARELGATTAWSASEVAAGMVSLGRMGFSTSGIENSISAVMDLARGLGVSIDAAAGMLGATLNQFGASAEDAGRYADILAKATNSAAISSDELGESLKYSGAAAAALGQNVESVIALTMALRNVGLDASQAGTTLRSMYLTLQDSSKAAAFEETFGVALRDANGNLRDLAEVLTEAQARAQSMGQGLAAAVEGIFGKIATTGAVSLLSGGDLTSFEETLRNADGAAAALRETMESGLAGSVSAVKSAVEGAAISLGEALAPELKGMAETITTVAGAISGFIQNNRALVSQLGENAAGLLALGVALSGVSAATKAYTGITGAAKTALSALSKAWAAAGSSAQALNTGAAAAAGGIAQTSNNANIATKSMQALRFAANGVLSALKGLALATAVSAGWSMVLDIFKNIAAYATKTADEMERARKANDERIAAQAGAVPNTEETINANTSRLMDVLDRTTRDNLTEQEKAKLGADITQLQKEGILAEGDVVAADTASGYKVADAAVEFKARQRIEDLALGAAASTFSDQTINPADYGIASTDAGAVKTQDVDLKSYETVLDTLKSMTESERRAFADAYNSGDLIGDIGAFFGADATTADVYGTAFMGQIGLSGTDEGMAKGTALLMDPGTKSVLDELMKSDTNLFTANDFPIEKMEDFVTAVKTSRQAAADFEAYRANGAHDFSADAARAEGQEYRAGGWSASQDVTIQATTEASAETAAAADNAVAEAQASADEIERGRMTTAESQVKTLREKRDASAAQMQELLANNKLTDEQRLAWSGALEQLDASIAHWQTVADKEAAQRDKEKQEAEKEKQEAADEETRSGIADAMTAATDDIAAAMRAGDWQAAGAALEEYQAQSTLAEGFGYNMQEQEAALADVAAEMVKTITPAISSATSFNAFEALDMTQQDDTALLREQRDYLKQLANMTDKILDALGDDADFI